MGLEVVVAIAAREAIGDEEHLTILVALLAMIVEEDKPRIGGSAPGRRKSKPRQRMEGYHISPHPPPPPPPPPPHTGEKTASLDVYFSLPSIIYLIDQTMIIHCSCAGQHHCK
jgi:hypothetical protein